MTAIKLFANRTVPIYLVSLIVLLTVIGSLGLSIYFRKEIESRQIRIPTGSINADDLQYGSIPALANEDFFNSVRNQFITEKATFIEANLSEMRLRYYKDGIVTLQFPIKTKGREGSWWETPAGLYKVESKIKNHFSAFAKVYLPWSMPFQGNFFIHGWPYYANGSPVSSSYSGGCIRLSTEDAQVLYEAVQTNTPVLVFEKDFGKDAFQYEPGVSSITANSYLAADLKNNFVFAEKNSKAAVPIASITKLMTALVAVEYINIDHTLVVNKSMIVPTSKPRLAVGDEYSIYDLLHPLLMESSNEAAEAIAGYLGRDYFIGLMNKKAKAIGMTQTVFTDPAGRDAGNISSAEDLFALAKYLYNNRSFILKMSNGKADSPAYGPSAFSGLQNFNVFGNDPTFLGGKVGQTEAAKQTIISVFEGELQGQVRPYVVIVLGSDDNGGDANRLLTWTKETY